MLDLLFKIKRNIPFVFRGGIIKFKMFFYRNVLINGRVRIESGVKLVIHPEAHLKIQGNIFIGCGSFISILPKGNLIFGSATGVGNNNQIVCHNKIIIGDNTIIGPNVMLFDHNHLYDFEKGVKHKSFDVGEIIIGNNCWLGAGSIILKDVHIGNNVVVAAGSVVTKDIPSGSVVAGVPAKIVKSKNNI